MKKIIVLIGLAVLLSACAVFSQTTVSPDAYKPVFDRLESLTTLAVPDWRYHTDIAHPEDPKLKDADWHTLNAHDKWHTGPRVLRRWIEIPENIQGYSTRGARVRLDLYFSSDSSMTVTVFSNGALVARGDEDMQQPIPLTEIAQPGQKFLIAVRVDAGEVDTQLEGSRLRLEPAASRPDPLLLREEIQAVRPLIAAFSEGKSEREGKVDAAVKAIDFTALDRGDQGAFDESLRIAQAKLQLLNPWLKRFNIRATGNSHIDMAWLWPWTETVEVVRNTFRSALDLMREYPDFTFTMSSAQTYSWMEEKYPDLFKEIQQRVREGRWEIVGGMWVEPDLNMPGGESLVRQLLTGKRYFQEKFGVDVKIGWNPDSFGYNWQLPQIYKKSGMDSFVTQKIYWNDTTKFPYKLFWWESPDGSRVLAYIPHDYANDMDPEKMARDLAAYAPAMYASEPSDGRTIMHLYGVGDHGGGPTRKMLDGAQRWMDPQVVFPKLRFGTARGFFDDLAKSLSNLNLPTWRDEMYFEYHRGVLTSQAETKKAIRHTEELLLNAEKYSALTMLLGKTYPSENLDRAWKQLLFDDFHDIFPGSGIAVNYLDAKRNLGDASRVATDILNESLTEISGRINTASGAGVPVIIFNSLSWPRTEIVEVVAQLPTPAQQIYATDSAAEVVASQLLSMDAETDRARILLVATVPALGYATYYVHAGHQPPGAKSGSYVAPVKSSNDSLENEFVRVKIDPKSGCMTSLFDKRSQTEAFAPAETDTGGPQGSVCGNLLQAFHDKPKDWDAWNIDADFEKEHWDLTQADEIKLVENGALRAILRVKTHFQNSTFIQNITLTAGSPRVDVNTETEWNEKHILLKVAFPVSAHNKNATFEIPYGTIERPTTRDTPAEQAKFEVPGLHWADLSDADHGFSLLNDCKYGYDAKGNVLRLSLLRSPAWPDPHADEGHHEFTYSLYAHGGSWREGLTVQRGYELNYPMVVWQAGAHHGILPASHSFFGLPDNVVLTAIKKAEDSDAVIVRFYEWAGKETDVILKVPDGFQSASEANLMEKPAGGLNMINNSISVHTKPYEIKTLRLALLSHREENK